MGTDVTFMYVSLPLRGLGVVSADVSVSEIGGPFRGELAYYFVFKRAFSCLMYFEIEL